MTPKRRDRFFSSLRQLELRLASESSPTKKGRLEECKELQGTEPGSANASSATKCGFAAVSITAADDDDETAGGHDFKSAGANADSKGGLADAIDASNCGLAAVNAKLRCVLADASAASDYKAIDTVNQQHAAYPESAGAGLTDIYAVNTAGAKAICPRLDTTSRDGVHIVDVDYLSHGRESSDSVTLCEEEEEIYDAVFSGDNNTDSGSLLELSAHWNPWEIGRQTCESDSHPPAEFLSIPMTNDVKDGKTPEFSAKSSCQDVHEKEEDDVQDLTRLCALLHLHEHSWLPEGKEASRGRHASKLFDESRLDSDALYQELPTSAFFCNVAKVSGGDNSSECAKALDSRLQQLWKSQTEPYSCALLLLAKASLQRNKDMAEGFSGEFPSIVQEWLALERVTDEQNLM